MTKTLRLEKRGCDFRTGSLEYKHSDLENYRLFGYVSKHECIEVGTWDYKKSKYSKFRVVKTYVDNQYDKKEVCTMADGTKRKVWMSYRNLEKCGTTEEPTKESVLKFVNEKYNKNFTKLEIMDRL